MNENIENEETNENSLVAPIAGIAFGLGVAIATIKVGQRIQRRRNRKNTKALLADDVIVITPEQIV